jgi:hypothetical protein
MSWRMGTPSAKRESHSFRSDADFLAVTCLARRKNEYEVPTGGLASLALNLFGRDPGHFVTCYRLFRVAVRLRESRAPTNCTWVSVRYRKGSQDLYVGLW